MPLPSGITEVLRLASGHAPSMAIATAATGLSNTALLEACRFYVEQQLLSRECGDDPWRGLGVASGAEPELIREHRRLLVGLVHPDRGEDWAAAFSDRVNRAWRQLKTPEGRRAAQVSVSRVEPHPGFDDGFGGDDVRPDDSQLRPTHLDNNEWTAGAEARPAAVIWQASDRAGRDSPASVDSRFDGKRSAATAVPAALLLVAVGLVVWSLLDRDWRGSEVLIPMGVEAPRAAAERSAEKLEEEASDPPAAVAKDEVQVVPTAPAIAARSGDSGPPRPATDVVATAAVGAATPLPTTGSQVLVVDPSPPFDDSAVRPASAPGKVAAVDSARAVTSASAESREGGASPSTSPSTPKPSVAAVVSLDNNRATRADAKDAAVPAPPVAVSDSAPSGGTVDPIRHEPVSQPAFAAIPNKGDGVGVAQADHQSDRSTPSDAVATTAQEPGAQAALTKRPPSDFSRTDVEQFLGTFSRHYASGDLSALIGLFSIQANSAKGGSIALAADYARLFASTTERQIAIRQLIWRLEDGSLRGDGQFEAAYHRKGRMFRQVVRGQISFVIVEENGLPRILRLDSRPG